MSDADAPPPPETPPRNPTRPVPRSAPRPTGVHPIPTPSPALGTPRPSGVQPIPTPSPALGTPRPSGVQPIPTPSPATGAPSTPAPSAAPVASAPAPRPGAIARPKPPSRVLAIPSDAVPFDRLLVQVAPDQARKAAHVLTTQGVKAPRIEGDAVEFECPASRVAAHLKALLESQIDLYGLARMAIEGRADEPPAA